MFREVSLKSTVANRHAAQILTLPERPSGTQLKLPSQDGHNNDILTRSLLSTVLIVCFSWEHFVIMATYMDIIISKTPSFLCGSLSARKKKLFSKHCPTLVPCSCAVHDSPISAKLQLPPQSSLEHLQPLSWRKFQSEWSQSCALDVERVKILGKVSKTLQDGKKNGLSNQDAGHWHSDLLS